jgi:16S rRNA processing protein RimM
MEPTPNSTSSTDLAFVGNVVGAHGLRGQLRVRADGAETLDGVGRLVLRNPAGGEPRAVEVEALAPGRRGELRLTLVGVDDRAAAEALRGWEVWAEVAQLEPLGEGEYYDFELVGCRLEGEDGTPVGTVAAIWRTGAPDVLVVDAPDGRQHLVPAALLRGVDRKARRAVAEILPGLLEGYEG